MRSMCVSSSNGKRSTAHDTRLTIFFQSVDGEAAMLDFEHRPVQELMMMAPLFRAKLK